MLVIFSFSIFLNSIPYVILNLSYLSLFFTQYAILDTIYYILDTLIHPLVKFYISIYNKTGRERIGSGGPCGLQIRGR